MKHSVFFYISAAVIMVALAVLLISRSVQHEPEIGTLANTNAESDENVFLGGQDITRDSTSDSPEIETDDTSGGTEEDDTNETPENMPAPDGQNSGEISTPDVPDDTQTEDSPEGAIQEDTDVEPEMHTVTYGNTGFTPEEFTIAIGDTVRFINTSDGGMWVASDSHPVHSDYPEFDQNTTASSGGVYEFTFDQMGTWGYHNHVQPGRVGTIVVQ